ncbi:UDP-N-acetylmuramoyl-L-alanyl-D-glutamate--2,6-diaminopimelate ligase [Rhodocytophaga rosea]|uniref:UDP-N-acetylmuramoyl-L-alanyl-D-glutamate--2,6-diaminopimelate ligase n=1 Tax=Rhodocytophaga rosea TaxID=2704465 RepID=A0A6C0GS76_9BACT|nr:UDP-N-acetylmuramoyl-L-alanyl-D-glutamate--2,6-diaminopimelate ligase [Rhodocytophaga rosea]QHT70938.1 UDP-N-acetylmuramoyl-L-alanyl-D-glutamate--2,6-diaminopimelate ligase [Rhodocytophaga rosea]
MKALLKDLLYKVSLLSVKGDTSVQISNICFDSRAVQLDSLFIAVKGTQTDGHAYIDKAIDSGAAAIVCEQMPDKLRDEAVYVQVSDSAQALGWIAANYYGNPSAKLKLVGVTGTNGKTTTVTLLHKLFRKLGYNTGLLSTVQNQINETVIPSTHTTPDAIQLNKLLDDMVKAGCTHAFMEVSSHAVVQHRVTGISFTGAIFTNITHDHLDFHKTFDNYIRAKKKFFDDLPSSAFALVNLDDKRGLVMMQNTLASRNTFSLQSMGNFKGKLIANTLHGLQMEIGGKEVWFKLIGNFNAYNLLGVYGTAILLGEESEEVLMELSNLYAAPGRFEQVVSPNGITGIVDYAHTPDALENVLSTIQSLREGNEQVITVVGCGGNRDATKRPLMAEIACKFSDVVILTSDNPRNEDPMDILDQMMQGVKITDRKKVQVIADRKEAITKACQLAKSRDIILVAGKGHETYQEIKGVKHPFDDRQVLQSIFTVKTH